MKKILLFAAVFFAIFFVNNVKAQSPIIDSVIVIQPILCPGDEATVMVYGNNSTVGTATLSLFVESGQPLPLPAWNWVGNVSIPANTFPIEFGNGTNIPAGGLYSGNYMAVVSDPSWSSTSGAYDFTDPLITDTFDFTIYPAVPILIISTVVDTNFCFSDCTASDSINILGGQAPYTITFTQTGNPPGIMDTLGALVADTVYSNLCAATYEVNVVDDNDCPASITFTIEEPDLLDPENTLIEIDSIICHNDTTGQIELFPSGGTPAYTFVWYDALTGQPIVPANTSNPTGFVLSPGEYYAVITDDYGCDTISDTITFLNPDSLGASTTYTDPTCDGFTDGDITITLSNIFQGAGGPFEYLDINSNWQVFPDVDGDGIQDEFVIISGLGDGTYNLQVRDVNGCNFVLPPDTLTDLDPIEFTLNKRDYNGFDVSCFGICDGEIYFDNLAGGTGSLYTLNGNPLGDIPDTTFNLCALPSDTTYIVLDSLGCIGSETILFNNEPGLFTINPTIIPNSSGFDVSCPGVADGIVNVTPTNGVNSIDYFITNSLFATDIPGNTVTATGVSGFNTNGEDTIIAIDENGCTDTTYTSLTEPPLFNWDIGNSNENCALSNGSAWVYNITGGNPFYTYIWTDSITGSNTGTNDTITGLSWGKYYLEVTDALGCAFQDSVSIDSSFILVDYVARVPCNGIDNAEITINTNGVLLSQVLLRDSLTGFVIHDYDSEYAFNGSFIQNDTIELIMTFGNNPSGDIEPVNLPAGVYALTVELYAGAQGNQGCNPVDYFITIGDSVSMHAALNDTLLSDLDLLCFGDSTSQIEIEVFDTFVDGSGSPLQGSPWNNSYGADYSNSGIYPTNTAPFNVLESNTFPSVLSYLPAGNYSIIINASLDVYSNCFDTVDVIVSQPDTLEFTLTSTPTSCNGGIDGTASILTSSGGTLPYTYFWRDSILGANPLINVGDTSINEFNTFPAGVSAGIYELTVTDAAGCTPAVSTVEVLQPTEITYSIDTVHIDICSETGSQTGEFRITSAGGVGVYTYYWWNSDSTYTSIDSTLIGINSDWYYFIVTDANGCSTETDSVFMPNGVDPILNLSSVNNVSCFGVADGNYIAVVDSTNQLGSSASPFLFWNPNLVPLPGYDASYTPQDSMTGPATIAIRVIDDLLCESYDTIIITQPDLLQITHFDTLTYIGGDNVSCEGSLDGELTINAIGGTRDFEYYIQESNSVTYPVSIDSVFSGLASTFYEAFVIDANGCLDSSEILFSSPDSLLIDSINLSTYIGGNNVSCLGFNDGSANVYVSGGNNTYSYSWSNGDVTNQALALFANVLYTVVVTDPNGCIDSASISLTEPTELRIDSFTKTNLICKGADNGIATIFVSDATPGYTYLWDNANSTIPTYNDPSDTVHSTADITDVADTLRVGWTTVEVWDANGCYIKDSVEITEPSISITIDSLDIVQMTCFNYNNASAVVYATGPVLPPYTYTLYDEFNTLDTTSQGNVGFTSGLSSGNYVALVEDALGCLYRDSFIIHPLDSVYIDSVIFTHVSCNGFDDGYINQILPMGGATPYEFSVDGGLKFSSWLCTQNPNTCETGFQFTGLEPGTHDVEIWDANGCANSSEITITEPEPMQVSITTNDYNNYQIRCADSSDQAFINVSGGAFPYTFEIAGGNQISNLIITQNSGAFNATGIYQGNYAFTITDANSCTYIDSVVFVAPDPITFTAIVTDVFCATGAGANGGAITAIVAGGVGQGNGSNYTYEWYDGLSNLSISSYNITNLSTGNYTIFATDANFCTGDSVIQIGASVLKITGESIQNVSCFEDCDGSITLNVSGGVPASSGAAYNYDWGNANQTINPAIGLCAATYTCNVTDMAGCIVSSGPIIVDEPVEFIANIILDNAIECNDSTGDLSISTTGGATNTVDSIWWSDGTVQTSFITNVIAGNYSVFVKDENGCSDTAHYNLVQPPVLTISVANIKSEPVQCKGEPTGEIHITASGGTPRPGIPGTYNYELFNMDSLLVDTITNGLEAQFKGLSTGNYYVVVTDNNECTYTTGNIFIDEPENELQITIDTFDETCDDVSSATVFPTGGTPNYTFSWDNGSSNPSSGFTDLGDPLYYQQLTAGANTSHTIIVADDKGCVVTETITLLGYYNVFLPNYSDSLDVNICLGETIVIDINEKIGLNYVWTIFDGLENDTVAMTADLTLPSDDFAEVQIFTLSIEDTSSCSISVNATVTINDLGPLCQSSEVKILLDESVSLYENGNVNFDTYEWSNTNGDILSNNSSFTYTPTQSDSFNLYVTDGICKGYCSVYVTLGVLPFDAISPNGDGSNDVWNIKDLGRYSDANVKLFNRWGQLLKEWKSSNEFATVYYPWEDLSVGTYYYIIDLGNGDVPQTGPLTIIK